MGEDDHQSDVFFIPCVFILEGRSPFFPFLEMGAYFKKIWVEHADCGKGLLYCDKMRGMQEKS